MGVRLIWEAVLHPLPNARGKSAAYLSQSARPLDRPTLIGPNRRKLTLCIHTRPYPTAIQPQPFFQPLHNRLPTTTTFGKLNQSSTVLQPPRNREQIANQSQPSFVSNQRTISAQSSHIREAASFSAPARKQPLSGSSTRFQCHSEG